MDYEECDDPENRITYYFIAAFSFAISGIATAPGWYSADAALLSMLAVSYWPFIVSGFMLAIRGINRNLANRTKVLFLMIFGLVPWFVSLALTNLIVRSLH